MPRCAGGAFVAFNEESHPGGLSDETLGRGSDDVGPLEP